jgi:protein SCO1/2
MDSDPSHLKFLRRHIWAISFVLGVVTLTLIRPCTRRVPDAPAVLYALPDFALVDERGQPFSRETMEGEVWVAAFVFTSCPSSCPAVTQAMRSLQDRYERMDIDVRLVSFSVDPETDTPTVLQRHAAEVGADPERWRFVTGSLEAMRTLVEDGFRLGVGAKTPTSGGLYDIAHATKLALIGPHGGVRGYYGIDEQGLDEVYHRSQHVLRDTRSSD